MNAVLVRFVRRLLRRPPPAPTYPRVVEGTLSSGRPYRFVVHSDPRTWPEDWPDDEPSFIAPTTTEPAPDQGDATESIDTLRPRVFPPLAVQLAALRLRSLELAGLLDDDDDDQERDRKLLWFFREQRDQIDEPR